MKESTEQNTDRGNLHKPAILPILVVFVVVIMVLIIVWKNTTPKLNTSTDNQPLKMKSYTDSGKYFSIKIPENWTSSERIAQNTTGLNTDNPIRQQVEITQLYIPAVIGVTIQVYKGQPTCPPAQPITTTFAGLPAAYSEANHTWTIPTTQATLVVSTANSKSGGFQGPAKKVQPTDVPQSVMDADRKLLEEIISTFKPNNLQPFSC